MRRTVRPHRNRIVQACVLAVLLMLASLPLAAQTPPPPPPNAAPPAAVPPAQAGKPGDASTTFSPERIEQLVAPIALYPDALLSQVLMAATYPADVVEAAQWSKANASQKGDEAVKAVEDKNWDPAVKSLVAFPQVIQTMGEKPDWVQNLGDAFLASTKDVLDAAQRLRQRAQAAGTLKTTEQQNVVVEKAPETQQQVIKIESPNPQVVYVPTYNPTYAYGPWPYPAYPPYYIPPPPGYYFGAALTTGLVFATGVAITGALWGGCNWGRGDVNVNVNRYNTVNSNRQRQANQTNFQHNAENRRGVPYADAKSREQFGKSVPGGQERTAYRGNDPSRDAQRAQAKSSLESRGFDSSTRADRQAGRGDNAFAGAGNGRQSLSESQRGQASQSLAERSGGRSSAGASRPSGGFSGASGAAAGTRAGGFSGGAGAAAGARGGGGGGRGGGGRR